MIQRESLVQVKKKTSKSDDEEEESQEEVGLQVSVQREQLAKAA